MFRRTIGRSHHLTISPSHHLTISPSHHLTISPSHHLTISPPQVWTNLFQPAFGNLLENPSEKTLLVHGGTGGIGSTALALAKSFGARTVTTVSSGEKAKAAAAFGADIVIDYTKEDFVAKTKEVHMSACLRMSACVCVCLRMFAYMSAYVYVCGLHMPACVCIFRPPMDTGQTWFFALWVETTCAVM